MIRGLVVGVILVCAALTGLALGIGRVQPHGRELLYTTFDGSRTWANRLDVDRKLAVRLPVTGAGFRWSPDGEQIAFSAIYDGDLDIFVMDATGYNIHPVTVNNVPDYDPIWSPDGTRIAYTSYGGGDGTDIYVINADGTNPRNLTAGLGSSSSPSWSADGKYLAFVTMRLSERTTYIIDLEDGVIRPFSLRLAQTLSLTWSPQRDQVLFVGFEANGNSDVYTLNIADSVVRNLTDSEDVNEAPIWSPDGCCIAYVAHERGATDIFELDIRTGAKRSITRTSAVERAPAWSPDGAQIAFISGLFGYTDLYMVEVATGEITRLTHDAASENSPMWRP